MNASGSECRLGQVAQPAAGAGLAVVARLMRVGEGILALFRARERSASWSERDRNAWGRTSSSRSGASRMHRSMVLSAGSFGATLAQSSTMAADLPSWMNLDQLTSPSRRSDLDSLAIVRSCR